MADMNELRQALADAEEKRKEQGDVLKSLAEEGGDVGSAS